MLGKAQIGSRDGVSAQVGSSSVVNAEVQAMMSDCAHAIAESGNIRQYVDPMCQSSLTLVQGDILCMYIAIGNIVLLWPVDITEVFPRFCC